MSDSSPSEFGSSLTPRQLRHLRTWLGSGAALTFLIIVIGGITRLTQSGLSIVDWDPVLGVVPPLDEAAWEAAFARYREFPEYLTLRRGMTLEEFRFIYFWEYLHRLLARTVGVVFLIPFLFFWRRGYLAHPPLRNRVLALFGLGALQGAMGWFMVMSGLVDIPRVSHYRLAAHFCLALTIFGFSIWLMRALEPAADTAKVERPDGLPRTIGVLLGLQVVWGAFVAGLDAGFIHNTFPTMSGRLLPEGGWSPELALLNLTENPATVQWVHRFLGTLLLLAAVAGCARALRRNVELRSGSWPLLFGGLVVVQYLLGIVTLLRHVPVTLGVVHQAVAVLIVGVWIAWWQHERQLGQAADWLNSSTKAPPNALISSGMRVLEPRAAYARPAETDSRAGTRMP